MKESSIVIITCLIFTAFALAGFFAIENLTNSPNFNFYKSELVIDGLEINETLTFHTDRKYHTLYRNFQNDIEVSEKEYASNYIIFNGVSCQDGNSYVNTYDLCYDGDLKIASCMAYTEANEYGCSFGDVYGFEKSNDYKISSSYSLRPKNIFLIEDNYYIKFVAYSPENHVKLITNNNLFVKGGITNNKYDPSDNAIIYIPYNGDISKFNIIEQESFEFDKNKFNWLGIIACLIPSLIFFFSWFFFGREKSFKDIPKSGISFPPNNRKAWEVAAYFSPPFIGIDSKLYSTIFIDLYNRKVIDIKIKSNETLLKINKSQKYILDAVEKKLIKILYYTKNSCSKKHLDGEYFNFKKACSELNSTTEFKLLITDLNNEIRNGKIKYSDANSLTWLIIPLFITCFLSFVIYPQLFILNLIMMFTATIIHLKTTVFLRFKDDYYQEYQHWQGFKRYLNGAPSLKEHGHKGVILWDRYLVYGTALGISKKVLKELRTQGLMTKEQERTFNSLNSTSYVIFTNSISTGSSSSGGGFSGAGVGGVGGGGGGGR